MWGLALILAFLPEQTIIKISPQTTTITEPLDAQGFIDYPKALNERLRGTITPEQNANILIWQAIGPIGAGEKMPADYFRWLGIDPPPEKGSYFQEWLKFAEKNGPLLPRELASLADDRSRWEMACQSRLQQACQAPWKASQYPDLARWLAENDVPLTRLLEASRRPKYFQPLTSAKEAQEMRLLGAQTGVVPRSRRWSEALVCRAMCKISDGQLDSAWNDLQACQRLGSLIASHSATLLEMMTGLALMESACRAQSILLNQKGLTSEQLRTWLQDLQKGYAAPSLAAKCDLGERLVTLDAIQSIAMSEWQQNGLLVAIDYNQALLRANHFYDRFVLLVQMKNRAERRPGLRSVLEEITQMQEAAGLKTIQAPFSPMELGNRLGHEVMLRMAPDLEKISNHIDRVEQRQRNLQVALALAAYRADKRSYPARLDDLTPTYLAKVPGDTFSGKSLLYKPSKEGYLLYSVGINEQDDGGKGEEDEPRGDDLRVRIP